MIMIDIHFSIFRYKSPKSLLSMLNTSVLCRLRTLHGEGLCFQRKHSNSTLNLPSIPYCGFSCCMPSKMPRSSPVLSVYLPYGSSWQFILQEKLLPEGCTYPPKHKKQRSLVCIRTKRVHRLKYRWRVQKNKM